MKKRKIIAFLIGFVMLFAIPESSDALLIYLFVWLPISIGLIAYSGAFINPFESNHAHEERK
mgnify:FL=1